MVNKNVEKLYRDIKKYPVMLYVGKHITNDELLLLKDLGWCGVITSRTDNKFCDLWDRDEIHIREILPNDDSNEIAKIDEKDLLPVVRLFGIDGEKYIDEDDIYSADDYAESLFQKTTIRLDSIHRLVVAGYDSQAHGELNFKSLIKSLTNAPNCSIQFWDCHVYDKERSFRDFCGRKRHIIETASLPDAFSEYIAYLDEVRDDDTAAKDVFFCNDNEIPYDKRTFGKQSGLYTLLTVNTVSRYNKPIGDEMVKNSYLSFLNKTPVEGPQWYGYQSDNCFYVKRHYEDQLYTLVTKMLRGHLDGYDKKMAVLQGPSGSSKSMVLGAVAYRIFEEKRYPVVFINNSDSELFAEGSANYEVLDSFLQKVEEKTARSNRILIVWDCSSYKSGESSAVKVMNYLRNNGRRFVMLCSSYKRNNSNPKYYKFIAKGGKREVPEEKAEFSARGVCYCVDSKSKLDNDEKALLWKSFYSFSGLSRAELDRLKLELEEKKADNIHYIYYRLFELIRPRIEEGLSKEEDDVVLWVAQEVSDLFCKPLPKRTLDIDSLSPVQRAMLKAGTVTEEELLKNGRDQNAEKTDIEEVFITIAMFGKFNIPVPYQIVLNSLRLNDVLPEDKGKIIDKFSEISLLYYHQTQHGYCFSYRNPFEAQIFLKNKDPRGEREFGILCDILNFYRIHLDNNEIRDMILKYLQLMGPNSNIVMDIEDSKEYFEDHMSEVVRILSEIAINWEEINDIEIVTSLVWTYLTFTREFYKHRLKDHESELTLTDFMDGIDDLQDALDTAAEVSREVERYKGDIYYGRNSHIFKDNRRITVEYSLINAEIQHYVDKYRMYCENMSIIPDERYLNVGVDYIEIYDSLSEIIPEDPSNAYIYNALFKCFENMYTDGAWTDTDKMNHLVLILRIISECNVDEIENAGNDDNNEFGNHINNIYGFVSGHNFSIDEIIRRDNGELDISNLSTTEQHHFSLYDSWMVNKNPVGITFVCHKELHNSKALDVDDKTVDLESKIASCQKVIDFMYSYRDNYEVVKHNSQAIALLIRTVWMRYNHSPLSAYKHRKITQLTQDNWREILSLCRVYDSLFNPANEKFKSKIIILLHAMSEMQVNDDFNKASEILRTIERNSYTSNTRRYTPYLLCDENGVPRKFSGKIITIKGDKPNFGEIKIKEVNLSRGVHFEATNIGKKVGQYEKGDSISGLEFGISFMGLSLYTEKGREYRGDFVE